jgi:lipid-binding SYLF domain-containing protein
MTLLVASLSRTALAALVLCGFALSPAPAAAASKEELDAHVHQAIQDLYRSNVVAKELAGKAAGVLVFPDVIKAGFWVGGQYGQSALLVGQSIVGHYNIVGASFGLQAGVQDESVAIMFMTAEALNKFRESKGWKIGVDGSVAVVTVGVGGVIDSETLRKPIIAFVFNNKGLMASLALEGSKITKIEKK